MFFVVIPVRRRVGVRLKGSGTFFCLNCEKTRRYECREWLRLYNWYEFILCTACEIAFKPECLDESTDAYLEELVVDGLPDRAIYTKLRSVYYSPTGLGEEQALEYYGDESAATSRLELAEELRVNPRSDSMIAYTLGRRH